LRGFAAPESVREFLRSSVADLAENFLVFFYLTNEKKYHTIQHMDQSETSLLKDFIRLKSSSGKLKNCSATTAVSPKRTESCAMNNTTFFQKTKC